jgi:hypothetical protein
MRSLPSRLIAALLCFAASASSGGILEATVWNGLTSGNVAEVRAKAENGDPVSQVAFGDILTAHARHRDALAWYQSAANQGNIAGQFHVGRTLLNGATGNPADQNVSPNPGRGIYWAFVAATNHFAPPCWDMSHALQAGLGTKADLVAAYAWLQLYSEAGPAWPGDRSELNEWALKLSTSEVQQGQYLASRFNKGNWQIPIIRLVPDGDPRLKLTSISISAHGNSSIIIHGNVLRKGEWATIASHPIKLRVKCISIDHTSATVLVEGENSPRILSLY